MTMNTNEIASRILDTINRTFIYKGDNPRKYIIDIIATELKPLVEERDRLTAREADAIADMQMYGESDSDIGRRWRTDSSLEAWFPFTAQELTQLRAQLAEEKAIVDRVWKALGIESYEQAKPLAIDEHVAKLKAQLAHEQEKGKVADWAQAVLTALNVGDVRTNSPLHLKLREVMVKHQATLRELEGE